MPISKIDSTVIFGCNGATARIDLGSIEVRFDSGVLVDKPESIGWDMAGF